jgi:hypothetical protein
VAPGDKITVTVLLTNPDNLSYPCFGLVGDHGVVGEVPGITVYALPPETNHPVELSAQLPPTLPHGTVVHFSAYVMADPCPAFESRLDFDVTVE